MVPERADWNSEYLREVDVPAWLLDVGSSNGRTAAFGAVSRGSNPLPTAIVQHTEKQLINTDYRGICGTY